MFVEVVVSMFGIVIVQRILSLVEKLEVLPAAILYFGFGFLQLPLYFSLFFKELSAIVPIYIGISVIFLIGNEKIIRYFRQNTFEKLHLQLIDRMILHLHAGKSASSSLKCVLAELSCWEKTTFAMLNEVFKINSVPTVTKNGFNNFYFAEMALILKSPAHIADQLKCFRAGLATQRSLRHKSRQSAQQIRAQAAVCAALYVLIALFAHVYLNFNVRSAEMLVSILMFLAGETIIFAVGGRIRWKT
jgi:hypothetical protein